MMQSQSGSGWDRPWLQLSTQGVKRWRFMSTNRFADLPTTVPNIAAILFCRGRMKILLVFLFIVIIITRFNFIYIQNNILCLRGRNKIMKYSCHDVTNVTHPNFRVVWPSLFQRHSVTKKIIVHILYQDINKNQIFKKKSYFMFLLL